MVRGKRAGGVLGTVLLPFVLSRMPRTWLVLRKFCVSVGIDEFVEATGMLKIARLRERDCCLMVSWMESGPAIKMSGTRRKLAFARPW